MIRLVPVACILTSLLAQNPARAQDCRELNIAYQPECFRENPSAPCNKRKTAAKLDLGPQIAIWLEKSDGSFVDTLMVTNLTAVRGLGNRPGRWDHSSSAKFPYGRRTNVLPIWAHARGRKFPRLIMQDGYENDLGFHETTSSPDPYYCRPMSLLETDVDAITCPTAVFNSSKGRYDPTGALEVYPPRNDLTRFTRRDCDMPGGTDTCEMSAASFATLNDLDTVAAATPPFEKTATLAWRLPNSLAPGGYVVKIEINKEFDQNASHTYPSYTDPRLRDSGIKTNIGQPSVLFSVPITIGDTAVYASATAMAGYGDWNGETGTIHAPDMTISETPGSGVGRLKVFRNPWGDDPTQVARVHIRTSGCAAVDQCEPAPAAPSSAKPFVNRNTMEATSAAVSFVHAMQDAKMVERYDIRYREGLTMTEAEFVESTPVQSVSPGAPGSTAEFVLGSLKANTDYVIGIRTHGRCQTFSPIETDTFRTPEMKYTQLSGCFVATAANQSPMAPQVQHLRWFRDEVLESTLIGERAVDLYYRSSPPVASVIASSRPVRAVVRGVLTPLVSLIQGFKPPFLPQKTDNSDQSRQTRR